MSQTVFKTNVHNGHLAALQLKHAMIDREIAEAHKRPFPCATELRAMKRRRLAIKERIAGFETAPSLRVNGVH